MNTPILYFAYGSNMNPTRIAERIPNARDIGVARLPDYRLAERLYADIDYAPGSRVWGVLHLVTAIDLLVLDRYEGCPRTYRRLWLEVIYRGERYPAMTYEMTLATKAQRQGRAYPEAYRKLCSDGAELHHIPNTFTAERKRT